MRPFLFIKRGPGTGKVIPFSGSRVVMGRGLNCDFRLQEEKISREHAEFLWHGGEMLVRDMGSRNGVYVNDSAIEEASLKTGDEISLGSTVFEFVLLHDMFEQKGETASHTVAGLPTARVQSLDFIGNDPGLRQVIGQIYRVAQSDMPVLVQGESGTGKELVARAIHDHSIKSEAPFVALNCAALSAHIAESELFGHIKGAFTGADKDHRGFFEQADGGTLFLDEIGELTHECQTKLLRVLQEKQIRRVGDVQDRQVEVRLIAATHKDLEQMVKDNLFREDLYYRLAVVVLNIPPLRDRGDDVVLLAQHFLDCFRWKANRPLKPFDDQALQAIRAYAWPGNVRELRNKIEQACLMGDGESLGSHDLGLVAEDSQTFPTLKELEKGHIVKALEICKGKKADAAKLLGIRRSTIYDKLKAHNISPPQ